MKKIILTLLTICAFEITNAQEKANHNTTRSNQSSGIMVKETGEGTDILRSNQKRCERRGGIYHESKYSGSWYCEMSSMASSSINLSKSKLIDNNIKPEGRNGKRKCIKSGGIYHEHSNGDYGCVYTSSISIEKKSKKRKCFDSGGVWATNAEGSRCVNTSIMAKPMNTKRKKRNKNFNRKGERIKRTQF